MEYVDLLCSVKELKKKNQNPELQIIQTQQCRSLFVDLIKQMHENEEGFKLIQIDEYAKVLAIILKFNIDLDSDLHQIEESKEATHS